MSAPAGAAPRYRSPLAPMPGWLRGLSALLLAMPLVLLAFGATVGPTALVAVGAAVAALYAAIWLWLRPAAFEVDARGLLVRFPLRAMRVARSDVVAARALSSADIATELGFALRIGAGGLWGGFGWLWTQRRGVVEFYVSRFDRYVMIERRAGRPLLVTPADADGLVRALGATRSDVDADARERRS